MSAWKEATGKHPIWEYKKDGDEIMGLLVEIKKEVGPNSSMLYTVEKKGGEKFGIWGSTVLDMRMSDVMVGEEVKITYKGTQPSKTKGRSPVKIFKVLHREPETEDEKDIEEALGV